MYRLALVLVVVAGGAQAQTATLNCKTTNGVMTCVGPVTIPPPVVLPPPVVVPPIVIPPVTGCSRSYLFKDRTPSDGCSTAPPGKPQLPNLLSGYRVRPPWNVAMAN